MPDFIFSLCFHEKNLHQHTIKPPCLQLPSGQTGTQFTFGFPGSPSFNTVRPVCILSISFTTRHFVCLFVFLPLYVSHPPSADNQHQISESVWLSATPPYSSSFRPLSLSRSSGVLEASARRFHFSASGF